MECTGGGCDAELAVEGDTVGVTGAGATEGSWLVRLVGFILVAGPPGTITFVCSDNSCPEPSDPDDVTCDGDGCVLEVCVDAVPGCADGKLGDRKSVV